MLTAREQEVFKIVYEDGQPYARAVDWLRIKIGTVNAHVSRIRAKYKAAGLQIPDNRKTYKLH